MNLAKLISRETNVSLENIMLLRHGIAKTQALLKYGATIEEYTLVQPENSMYDFIAKNKTPIQIVVAIVDDKVYAVYRIYGVERFGTTRTLVSKNFCKFDIELGYKEKPAKLFRSEKIESSSTGKFVRGWTSPRSPVAKYGGRLFETVVVS